jgi:hypothetical protein
MATAAKFTLLPTSTQTPTPTIDPEASLFGSGYGPRDFPEDVNPLTGLIVDDPSVLNRRPLVIKITNFPRDVRPQWGLSYADHIYEYYLEDGLTRFIGVFYGKDASRVGPIRSARPFDEYIVRMYNAFFVFGYADDRVIDLWDESDLRNFLVIERPDNCPPLCRIGSQNNYNTLFGDTKLISQYVSERGTDNSRQDLTGLRFEETSYVTSGGAKVDRVEIRYSNTSHNYWEYDPGTQRYLRWQEDESAEIGGETYQPLMDSLTNQQVAADNLVILFVPTGYFFESKSTEIYDIALKDGGEAYILRQGRIFKGRWLHPTIDSLILITSPNGVPFPLKPGNVWFEVLSEVSEHQVKGTTWKFLFDLNLE